MHIQLHCNKFIYYTQITSINMQIIGPGVFVYQIYQIKMIDNDGLTHCVVFIEKLVTNGNQAHTTQFPQNILMPAIIVPYSASLMSKSQQRCCQSDMPEKQRRLIDTITRANEGPNNNRKGIQTVIICYFLYAHLLLI